MEKAIVVRKDHVCCNCDNKINKGEKATFYSERAPTFDKDDYQIGIEYIKLYFHTYNCMMTDECKKGNHKWERETSSDDCGSPTGYEICTECGEKRKTIYVLEV